MKHIFYSVLFFVLCSFSAAQAEKPVMKISSPVFAAGGSIPAEYTCDGANTPPALTWQGVPEGTKSLALIVDDPDAPAGTWVHWVAFDIPAESPGLSPPLSRAIREGNNSFTKIGYGGPCPPKGHGPHRYFFRLYALDEMLSLPAAAANSAALQAVMKDHILATAELMGRFEH